MEFEGFKGGVVRFASLAALIALLGCADSSDPLAGIDLTRGEGDGAVGQWVHSGYYNRTYDLHVPPGADAGAPRPLLIVLHGAGDTGHAFRARIAADAVTDAAGFITVYPDGVAASWAVGCGCTEADVAGANDVRFLETLVHQLEDTLPIDPGRIYVAGFSQGGQLAQRFACESDMPAGVVSVAALLVVQVSLGCTPPTPLDVLLIHGTEDPVMRYGGFGTGSTVLSADAGAAFWAEALGCADPPVEETRPDDNHDGTSAVIQRRTACAGGGSVVLDRIDGGGHTWPGPTGPWPKSTGKLSRNLDATVEIARMMGAEVSR